RTLSPAARREAEPTPPQKQNAVLRGERFHRKRRDLVNRHSVVMPLGLLRALLGVRFELPGRVCEYDGELFARSGQRAQIADRAAALGACLIGSPRLRYLLLPPVCPDLARGRQDFLFAARHDLTLLLDRLCCNLGRDRNRNLATINGSHQLVGTM